MRLSHLCGMVESMDAKGNINMAAEAMGEAVGAAALQAQTNAMMSSPATAQAAPADASPVPPPAADSAPQTSENKGGILQAFKGVKHWFASKGLAGRRAAIKALPSFIVNNSPNVIGAMQLTAELAMFKSNGSDLVSPQNRGKPLYYLIDPPRNVWRSVTTRAKVKLPTGEMGKGEFYKTMLRNVVDVKAASAADLKVGPLINHWQARATFAGIVGWGLNFITPNAKETDEEIANNVKLQSEKPLLYMVECLRRAVVFPFVTVGQLGQRALNGGKRPEGAKDIGAYKRYFSGLGMLVAGTCSFLGGWRNVAKSKALGTESYYFNWQYCATGLVTFCSSLPLLFSVDNNQGYSRFGAIHLMRCLFLPGSIIKKFNSGDKGAGWYVAGHGMLQSKNAFAAFAGGAKKIVHEDGTVEIIDHSEEIEKAKKEAALAKQEKKSEKVHGHASKSEAPDINQILAESAPIVTAPAETTLKKAAHEAVSAPQDKAPRHEMKPPEERGNLAIDPETKHVSHPIEHVVATEHPQAKHTPHKAEHIAIPHKADMPFHEKPSTHVSKSTQPTRAMPERAHEAAPATA